MSTEEKSTVVLGAHDLTNPWGGTVQTHRTGPLANLFLMCINRINTTVFAYLITILALCGCSVLPVMTLHKRGSTSEKHTDPAFNLSFREVKMNKLVSNNYYCQSQAPPAWVAELVFVLSCWSEDQGERKGQILPRLGLCLCVMHFTAICLFLASMAARKKKKKECLKRDPSKVFSVF